QAAGDLPQLPGARPRPHHAELDAGSARLDQGALRGEAGGIELRDTKFARLTCESEKYSHRTVESHQVFIVQPSDVIAQTHLSNRRDFVHHQSRALLKT